WRHVTDEKDIVRPRKLLRILRAADEKFLFWQLSRRFDQQLHQSLLTVCRIRAEIGKITAIPLVRCDSKVIRRINAAVQWRRTLCAKLLLQRMERFPTRVAQNQIKAAQSFRA